MLVKNGTDQGRFGRRSLGLLRREATRADSLVFVGRTVRPTGSAQQPSGAGAPLGKVVVEAGFEPAKA